MPNLYEKTFGIPKPKCCSSGDCCKGVSPSTPYHRLIQRAATGDEFARNFLSIMVPYASHDEARQVVSGVVDKTLEACRKLPDFENNEEDVVFYHCRYLRQDNKCGIHEDRPQFCRDYPDTPFVVMSPNCAYVPWGKACKQKYFDLKDNLESLQQQKIALEQELTHALDQSALNPGIMATSHFTPPLEKTPITADTTFENLQWILSLTNLYLASPLQSFLLAI